MSPVLGDADNRTGHTKPTGSQNRWHNDAGHLIIIKMLLEETWYLEVHQEPRLH